MSKDQKYKQLSLEERELFFKYRALNYSYLMEGNKADKQVILVSIERKSRYIKLTRLQNKESIPYMQAQINQMRYLPVQTITADNGLENVLHRMVSEALKADYYFCHGTPAGKKEV